MEFVTGVPLAVGVGALHMLNAFLDDKRIAIAWYGKSDYKVFTRRRWIGGRLRIGISHVFSLPENESIRLIRDSVESSQNWYASRSMHGGECCWLPIYRSLRENRQVKNHPNNVVADAQSAIFSLGAVGSLPAARIDLWGLVVMAYANGAKESISMDSGAYIAVLRARYFVLTIRRQGLTDQAVAHIEPREKVYHTAQLMGEQAWRDLLDNGHSFSKTGYSGWPLYANLDTDLPPENLISGELDVQLRNEVFDELRAADLKKRLTDSVRKCRNLWENCYKELKGRNKLIESHDPETSETIKNYNDKVEKFTDLMSGGLDKLISLIETQPENALKSSVDLRDDPEQWFWWESKGQDWAIFRWSEYWRYGELMRWHNVIIVLVRFFVLSTKIDKVLSSRSTGDTVLLAGSGCFRMGVGQGYDA